VKRYSAERKEAILRQMMAPMNKLVSTLARENGISEQTLYTWRRNLKSQGVPVPGNGKNAEEWSSEGKFGVVLETAQLNEAQLAQYCRGKGLFVEQIGEWRKACQEANAHPADRREQREQSKSDKREIKQLKKDLQRKEKALAEAAALIILRKKAQAIWGEPEED
jgi:transposase-like protein